MYIKRALFRSRWLNLIGQSITCLGGMVFRLENIYFFNAMTFTYVYTYICHRIMSMYVIKLLSTTIVMFTNVLIVYLSVIVLKIYESKFFTIICNIDLSR